MPNVRDAAFAVRNSVTGDPAVTEVLLARTVNQLVLAASGAAEIVIAVALVVLTVTELSKFEPPTGALMVTKDFDRLIVPFPVPPLVPKLKTTVIAAWLTPVFGEVAVRVTVAVYAVPATKPEVFTTLRLTWLGVEQVPHDALSHGEEGETANE